MKLIETTYEIIAWKCLGKSVDKEWSDWATELIKAGFETEHIVELAGIGKPYNQFELKVLTDRVFEELNLDFNNKDKILKNYVSFLCEQVLNSKRDLLKSLRAIRNICIELDYDKSIYDFYSLYNAKEDLNYSEVQWYWNGADRENIDEICINYIRNWTKNNPLEELSHE